MAASGNYIGGALWPPVLQQAIATEGWRHTYLGVGVLCVLATLSFNSEHEVFQNYKVLQFIDTLALYFNRIHPTERVEQNFENVPVSHEEDVTVTIRPAGENTYSLSPFPFATESGEFAFCGRRITPADGNKLGGWPAALKQLPTEWEYFRLVAR